MTTEQRLSLIKQVGEEILTEEELVSLFDQNAHPLAYDGFEPSGRIHIAQGILRTININKMTATGCSFLMWVADWHAWANRKLGGNLEDIQTAGRYFIEVWKACGMETKKIKFLFASEVMGDAAYWKKVLQISQKVTIQRAIRCGQIMGRKEGEMQQGSQILYPFMQCADIFHLNIDICQLGMDQRKVNILAREIAPTFGWKKPVAVHHHMLMGLQQPQAQQLPGESIERTIAMKMSKSMPDFAIFMDDPAEEVERKIKKAWCPEKQAHENPVLEYCKYMIFEKCKTFKIERPAKYGGDLIFPSYQELADAYAKGELFPLDLKLAVAKELNRMLDPVRRHFSKGKAKELMETVKGFEVTR